MNTTTPYTVEKSSLLKKVIVEFYEREKRRKLLSFTANSQHFGSKTWYFASLKTHQLTFSTG
jgi:hypothetical protein